MLFRFYSGFIRFFLKGMLGFIRVLFGCYLGLIRFTFGLTFGCIRVVLFYSVFIRVTFGLH